MTVRCTAIAACIASILGVAGCEESAGPRPDSAATRLTKERWAKAETQNDMNAAAESDQADAEIELQSALRELRNLAAANRPNAKRAVQLLDSSQTAWKKYVDAQIAMEWPQGSDIWHGSIEPMCISMRRAKLFSERTCQLREMLRREDGDLCGPRWPSD